ncbi:hypothetical protein H257_13039 [Aphanomyces astaci]|uniref:Uncharacterized protein n=1 Tax=Aphanomyces astaci TaxID=112090 RepID=W4FYM4_APHAT|nr:hypothetical protein H257_13039 [Aphanomyces astaci]ETV71909.1 hypothetical protein H257_13039 [Aphanomyces astaci]|eukprot:XP_009838758.1 hypothetical protein H257_13039 [Aphanomyces astaci]
MTFDLQAFFPVNPSARNNPINRDAPAPTPANTLPGSISPTPPAANPIPGSNAQSPPALRQVPQAPLGGATDQSNQLSNQVDMQNNFGGMPPPNQIGGQNVGMGGDNSMLGGGQSGVGMGNGDQGTGNGLSSPVITGYGGNSEGDHNAVTTALQTQRT